LAGAGSWMAAATSCST